jgi:hypothetical protein
MPSALQLRPPSSTDRTAPGCCGLTAARRSRAESVRRPKPYGVQRPVIAVSHVIGTWSAERGPVINSRPVEGGGRGAPRRRPYPRCPAATTPAGRSDIDFDAGVRCPEEVAAVGVDNWDVMAQASRPPLTAIDVNLRER